MKKNIFKNNKLFKMLAWSGFSALMGGAIAGTTVGVVNFANNSSQNKGTNFEDSVETVINVGLEQDKTISENNKVLEEISNKIITKVQNLGVSQISISSSIRYLPIVINDTNSGTSSIEYLKYGAIHIYTEQNIPNYVIDFNSDDYVSRVMSKFALYNAIANNYNYKLETINLTDGSTSIPNNVNSNFNTTYQINSSDNKATRNNNVIDIPLTLKEDKNWNLDIMQKQFTDVYKWDGETDRDEAMKADSSDSSDSSATRLLQSREDTTTDESDGDATETFIKTTPELTYIFWQNRAGLINKLQLLSTIGYLYDNSSNFDEKKPDSSDSNYKNDPYNYPVTTINSFYDYFVNTSSDDVAFIKWIENQNNYFDVMMSLYISNQTSFGITNANDPLISLLKDFFNSEEYKNSDSAIEFDDMYNGYDFLFSWNTEKISLLDGYLSTIDYNNFWNYFSDNTNSEDPEIIKTTYSTNKFTITSLKDESTSKINETVNLINNASFQNPIIVPDLASSIVNVSTSNVIYKDFINFCNSFVFLYPNYLSKSITELSPYNGVLVGVSALILLIGIVVSILYRFPGIIAFITSAFSFGLSLIIINSLNSLFSISTFLSLIVSIICMFVPFINSQIHLRNSIKYNGNNLFNAYLNSIRSFIKTSITTYIPLIITSLVFLFFGNYQINDFGSSLVVILFSNVISSCFVFMILYGISYVLFLKNNPKFVLTKQYISILNKLKIRGAKISLNSSHNFIDKCLDKLLVVNKKSLIIYGIIPLFIILASIIGCILMATVGAKYVSNFYNLSQLNIYFNSNDLSAIDMIISKMTTELNIDWKDINILSDIYKNGDGIYVSQYILVSKNALNISEIFDWIKVNGSIEFNGKVFKLELNNVSSVTLNNTIPSLLFNNAIECIFISIAFISVFSLIYLNFLNFIPILLITIITNISTIGVMVILRIPFDINTIIVFLALYAISNVFIFNTYNNLLWKFNKKLPYSKQEIFTFVFKQLKISIKIQLFIIFTSLIYGLSLMLFVSTDLVYNQLMLFLGTIVIFIVSLPLCFVFVTLMLCFRELYIEKVRNNKKTHVNKVVYDKIDEQAVIGINTH